VCAAARPADRTETKQRYRGESCRNELASCWLEGLLGNQSTAHVSRGGDPFRAGDGFEFEGATPPPGFDRRRDGVCVHRQGTILYLSPNLPSLLARGAPGVDMVGARLADLIAADDPNRAAQALATVAEGEVPPPAVVAFPGLRGGVLQIELTFAHANRASAPVDVIWFRICGHRGLLSQENEKFMPIKAGDREPGSAARATVLICDDEARLGALTAGLLTEYGFTPITVGTGEAALDALGEGNPSVDIVLLDVNLSAGQSAREVLTAMRARGAQARVILTSGLAEEDVDADLVGHPSVVGYIAKPYGVDQLVQSINRALGL
jgi:CheY-like chemotaxis protein